MTDYCHNHSGPIPVRTDRQIAECQEDGWRCVVCWLTHRDGRYLLRVSDRFWTGTRLDNVGQDRTDALITAGDRDTYARIAAKASWAHRPDEANAISLDGVGVGNQWLPRVLVRHRERVIEPPDGPVGDFIPYRVVDEHCTMEHYSEARARFAAEDHRRGAVVFASIPRDDEANR